MKLPNVRNIDLRATLIYWMFAGIFLFFAILLYDDGFLQSNNLLNILRQTATITVMAVGMTFVISAAEIDLLAKQWGVTKQQAEMYLDFFKAINDGKLEPKEIDALIALGVDGLISDYPNFF